MILENELENHPSSLCHTFHCRYSDTNTFNRRHWIENFAYLQNAFFKPKYHEQSIDSIERDSKGNIFFFSIQNSSPTKLKNYRFQSKIYLRVNILQWFKS